MKGGIVFGDYRGQDYNFMKLWEGTDSPLLFSFWRYYDEGRRHGCGSLVENYDCMSCAGRLIGYENTQD